MDICSEIYKISVYIKEWIYKQQAVKEETLTDWLLFQFSENIPNTASIIFNRFQEARVTGADWEWWFLFPTTNYRLRIQAKKMANDNYSSIAYSNKYGLQIEKLLQDAIKTNSIPFYVFYSAENGKTMCKNEKDNEGVFIVGANKIYKSFISCGRTVVTPYDLIKISNVLSCFFCCPLINQGNNFNEFIKSYYEFENAKDIIETLNWESDIDSEHPFLGMHKRLPSYVSNLVIKRNGDLSYYEEEFRHDIEGINALLICDFRENIQ
jgi:hypothetical protein